MIVNPKIQNYLAYNNTSRQNFKSFYVKDQKYQQTDWWHPVLHQFLLLINKCALLVVTRCILLHPFGDQPASAMFKHLLKLFPSTADVCRIRLAIEKHICCVMVILGDHLVCCVWTCIECVTAPLAYTYSLTITGSSGSRLLLITIIDFLAVFYSSINA